MTKLVLNSCCIHSETSKIKEILEAIFGQTKNIYC